MYNKDNIPIARKLRRDMTREERKLWYDCLRNLPIRFYRQKPIGNYIADFYCPKLHLVIELDGSQHYQDKGIAYDMSRSRELNRYKDIRVLRIPNNQINQNFNGVCEYIYGLVDSCPVSNWRPLVRLRLTLPFTQRGALFKKLLRRVAE